MKRLGCGEFSVKLPEGSIIKRGFFGSSAAKMLTLFGNSGNQYSMVKRWRIEYRDLEVIILWQNCESPKRYLTEFLEVSTKGKIQTDKCTVNGISYDQYHSLGSDWEDYICSFHGKESVMWVSCQAPKITEKAFGGIQSIIRSVQFVE